MIYETRVSHVEASRVEFPPTEDLYRMLDSMRADGLVDVKVNMASISWWDVNNWPYAVAEGDWIVHLASGRYVPMNNEMFEAGYAPVCR